MAKYSPKKPQVIEINKILDLVIIESNAFHQRDNKSQPEAVCHIVSVRNGTQPTNNTKNDLATNNTIYKYGTDTMQY